MNTTTRVGLLGFAGAVALAMVGCGGSDASAGSDCSVEVSQLKELLIVDDAVMTDARARNDVNGVWSFRHALEEMTPPGTTPSEFVLAWLHEWGATKIVNGFPLDRPGEERELQMRERVICPWLKAVPENQCDATCSKCAAETLDLAKSPFRLIGIANRMDLAGKPIAKTPAGEARLLFGLTRGPADDPASAPAPFTIIIEYALPTSQTPEQWAADWHTLGKHTSFDEPYKAALANVTEKFVRRNVAPVDSSNRSGSALSQVRTNESELNWIWQLRQFELDLGVLRLKPLTNTPGYLLDRSPVLAEYIKANLETIKTDTHVMPVSMRGASVDQLLFRWQAPGVDEPARRAFSRATCNGCHSSEEPNIDVAFHVSPFRSGPDKLSKHLYDPGGGGTDQLTARATTMKTLLCKSR